MAAVLGRKFKAAGHTIAQIYSRNAAAATELAYEWDSESTNYKTTINKQADVYIIAVSDNAIDEVVDELRLPGRVVAHTAASVPKEVLKKVTDHFGVFYPLQSLRKEMIALPDVPIFFEGNDATAKQVLEQHYARYLSVQNQWQSTALRRSGQKMEFSYSIISPNIIVDY